MRRLLFAMPLLALPLLAVVPQPADSACCYFAAKDKDILQPAQKAFLTWDAAEKVETFTVQPKFEGNAKDFGMVIPTPAKPKLDEMPREFFKELAVFTILEPMDIQKYKNRRLYTFGAAQGGGAFRDRAKEKTVKVLEAGVVGSLDYKIIQASKADDLYEWLKDNKYSYSGDEATLDFYIKKGWFFTVMKIDPMQMKKRKDGSYEGEVTPTRFTFASDKLVYPLKITQLSVKDKTEALFYVQTAHKVDLPGDFSYEFTWTPMWSQATGFAVPEKLTEQEARLAQARPADRPGRPQEGERPARQEARAGHAGMGQEDHGQGRGSTGRQGEVQPRGPEGGRGEAEAAEGARQEGAIRDQAAQGLQQGRDERRPGVRAGQGGREGRQHRVRVDIADEPSVTSCRRGI